jgi:hypothetical protein
MPAWRVPAEWPGETAFIVAGGPSVAAADLSLLAGRRVIAVNSSWPAVPAANFLFFGDPRWWGQYGVDADLHFAGRIVSGEPDGAPHPGSPRILKLRRAAPPGLAADPGTVAMAWTSLTGAINLAVHLGVAAIVLLGADGKPAADGANHHHAPHPWDPRAGCFDRQREDLASLVHPLRTRGIRLLNASPGSAWGDLWPVVTLPGAIALLSC